MNIFNSKLNYNLKLITESTDEQLIEFSKIYRKCRREYCNRQNPLIGFQDIYEYKEGKQKLLYEGLIWTYPPKAVIDYIENLKEMKENDNSFVRQIKNGVRNNCITITVTCCVKHNNKIINLMNTFGYKLENKSEESIDNPIFPTENLNDLNFVAKYDIDVTDKYKNKELYHLTPAVYYKKIMKNGLTPKCKNTTLKYPDRVYFLLDKKNIKFLINNDDFTKGNTYFVLLKIKLPNNTPYKFFYDPRMNDAIYTHDVINPSYIYYDGLYKTYFEPKNKI